MPPRESEHLLTEEDADSPPPPARSKPQRGADGAPSSRSPTRWAYSYDAPPPVESGSAPPAPARLLLLRFLFFSVSFSVAESALVVSVSLAARLFGRTGSACVGAMYVAYAIGTLFAGQVIRWTTTAAADTGPGGSGGGALKPSLAVGQACLIPFHLAGLWAVLLAAERGDDDDSPLVSGLLLEAGVRVGGSTAAIFALCASIAGASAGIAWAAAGAFVTNTALAVSAACAYDDDDDDGDQPDVELANQRSYSESGTRQEIEIGDCSKASQENGARSRRHRHWPLLDALLSTDFRSLAGNLTGLFNVVLLASIFGGHAWSAQALRPEACEDDRCVARTYATICAAGIAGVVMMVFFVRDPEVMRDPEGAHHSSVETPRADRSGGKDATGDERSSSSRTPASSAWSKVLSDVRLTFRTPQIAALAWTHLASGFNEGLLLCYVGGALIRNPANIGILAGVKTASSAIGAPVFSLLGNSDRFGRVNVLVVGALAYAFAVAAVAFVASDADALPSSLAAGRGDGRGGGEDDMAALLLVYGLAGVGFCTWQGTAGGAFLSEIAASLSSRDGVCKEVELGRFGEGKRNDSDSTAIVAAAFSASKALSGSATAIAFFVFSREWAPYPLIVGWCFASTSMGLMKVVLSERRGIWSGLSKGVGPSDTPRTRYEYGSVQMS